jgi:hypothetical protein
MITRIRPRQSPSPHVVLAVVVAIGLAACGSSTDRDRASIAFGDCPAALDSQLAQFAPDLAPKVDPGCGQLAV